MVVEGVSVAFVDRDVELVRALGERQILDLETDLALTVQLAAGLAGVMEELTPPDAVNTNVFAMSSRERQRLRIEELPRNLGEALDALAGDRVVRAALGEHIFSHFTQAKRTEFETYLAHVHPWEVERYRDL